MHDRRSGGRAAIEQTLERSSQILPVPLGGLAPTWRQSSAAAWWWRRHQPAVLIAAAVAAIVVAVWVSTSPRSFTVAARESGVSIDGEVLTPAVHQPVNGTRVFTGQGSLAISAPSSGSTRAGAVMTWGGLAVDARCVLQVAGRAATDACVFTTEKGRVASVDTFDFGARVWHRHYEDGIDVTIAVPAGNELIPIPFPLGR